MENLKKELNETLLNADLAYMKCQLNLLKLQAMKREIEEILKKEK